MSSDQQTRGIAEQIEALVERLAASPDPAVRRDAQELVRLLMTLYGDGLARVLQILEREEPQSRRLVDALLEDDLISSLLVLHDLHPDDAETRIARGLGQIENAAGATISLLDVRGGTARVKVDTHGTASMLDLPRLIDEMVRAVAPDIARVDVEGMPPAPPPALVQLSRR
jgi:hypothetical protein